MLCDAKFKSIKIRKVTTRTNNTNLMEDLEPLYSAPLPIEKSKLKSLIRMCDSGTIPSVYRAFYNGLVSNETCEENASSEEDV